MKRLYLIQTIALIAVLACGFIAGRAWPRATYQQGYDAALEDVASGEVTVESAATRARDERLREFEYERVVSAVAEAYHRDPSEVEMDAGLVDSEGKVKR